MPVQKIKEIGDYKLQEICLTIENHIAVMKLQPLAAAVAIAGLWYEIWLVQDYINQNKYHAGGPHHEGRKRERSGRIKGHGTRPIFLCRHERAKQIGKMLSR